MAQEDIGYDTTVKVVRHEDEDAHFLRRSTLRDQLLKAALPALWALVAAVVVMAFWWA
jgi:hypothetical protein